MVRAYQWQNWEQRPLQQDCKAQLRNQVLLSGEWLLSNETQRVGGRGAVNGNARRKNKLIKIKREWGSERNWLQGRKERSWVPTGEIADVFTAELPKRFMPRLGLALNLL